MDDDKLMNKLYNKYGRKKARKKFNKIKNKGKDKSKGLKKQIELWQWDHHSNNSCSKCARTFPRKLVRKGNVRRCPFCGGNINY